MSTLATHGLLRVSFATMSLKKFFTSAGGGISIQYEDDVDSDSQNEDGPSPKRPSTEPA